MTVAAEIHYGVLDMGCEHAEGSYSLEPWKQ